MQVVPNTPGAEATGSEKKVLSLLRSIDWGGGSARALNSLNLAEHAYQRWGEIDFLLVGAKGLIAIEVKGGDVSCRGGRWHYEDRSGRVVTRNKSPLVQAKDAFFSLDQNYIAPRMGAGFSTNYPAGFCVILAGMARSDLQVLLGGPEFPQELIGAREDIASPSSLQKFLEGVATYWVKKNNSARRITERAVGELTRLLRPEFERVQALALARDRFNEELLALTEEQYEVLDLWSGADRIFCSSPAGCGKTLIAVEMARRSIADGNSVLLLVGSEALAAALREKTGVGAAVHTMGDFEGRRLEELPKASVLIIDEGQQLLSMDCISILDGLLQGGLDGGRWAWFGDVNYQSPCSAEEMAAGLARLAEAATVRPRLSKNCRNTPEIITTVELASGVPLGHAIVSGRGQHPTMLSAEDRMGAVKAVGQQVRVWLDEEISLASITLLTNDGDPLHLANEVGRAVGLKASAWGSKLGGTPSLAFARIEDFRGLESGFLALCLTGPCPNDEELGRMLYLGMTRANFALVVVATPHVLDRIHARMASNAASHLNGRGRG